MWVAKMNILNLINRDVQSENETRRGMVTLRLLYVIQFFVFLLDLFFAGPDPVVFFKCRIIASLLCMVLLFFLTFHVHTETAIVSYTVFTFIWILEMIPCFGWSAGMQNYYIIILMMSFFATHGSKGFKFTLAFLVLTARILSIFCYGGMLPEIPISDISNKLIQTANITAVFTAIVTISYIYSQRENEAESKLMAYNDRLVKEAGSDQLTGLFNRRRAKECLAEMEQNKEIGTLSIVMGDIDFFKKVNDTYGHDAGDEVLKSVAQAMREKCAKDAFLCRWGGEEFLMVFSGKNGDETYGIIEEFRRYIMGLTTKVKDAEISITMTFGIAEYDFNGNTESTIKEADEKLYIGKQNGRNRVIF